MMSASREGEQRLAEILREILDLAGTKPPNHSKSTVADDSVKSSDTQSGNGIHHACAVGGGKQTSEKRSELEKRD